MKKIAGFAIIAMALTACSDAGNRTVETPTNEDQQAPVSDPNRSSLGPIDSSTNGVSDSSTVIGYDTAARKRH